MKALVYGGSKKISVENRPKPVLCDAGDAIVRMLATTICGTDLHILKGDVPTCAPGRILGHEGVGVVEEIGAAVTRFKTGDRVLISCISSCGKCHACRSGMYSHCESGGWILGNAIDGTQAQFVRIPHADTSLYTVPPGVDEAAIVMLSDILPTGFECGVLNGRVQPGGAVAIVGAGPVGLAALLTSQLYSPGITIVIDLDDNRLAVAKTFGADHVINAGSGDIARRVLQLTGGHGVETAIEAVGIPATFELCEEIVAPGGTVANVGVHGVKVDLHLETLWSKNISITTRLVDTTTTPTLLRIVESGRIDPKRLISHRFDFSDILNAYDTFRRADATRAMKVVISFDNDLDASTAAHGKGIDLTTSGGLPIFVRAVQPSDETRLADFFRHMTPEDLRFRFLGGIGELGTDRLAAMTNVDHRQTEHFLAFVENEKILVATAMISCDAAMREAEVAIAVHEDFRHKGIAWELLRHVAAYAQAKGISVIQSIESRANHDAIALEREQGFSAEPYPDDPTLVLVSKRFGPAALC